VVAARAEKAQRLTFPTL
jgi:hypothetical protein